MQFYLRQEVESQNFKGVASGIPPEGSVLRLILVQSEISVENIISTVIADSDPQSLTVLLCGFYEIADQVRNDDYV